MGQYLILPDVLLKKIEDMFLQGYAYEQISLETGVTVNIIRNRLGRTKEKSTGQHSRGIHFVNVKITPVANKYDYKFEEKKCEGRMYNQYFKQKRVF